MRGFAGLALYADNLLINDGRSFPNERESNKNLLSDYRQRLGVFKLNNCKKKEE